MPLLEDLYNKQRAKQVELLPFFYSTAFLSSVLTSGATIVQTIGIQSDSHFVARYFNITAYATGLVIATATPPLTIQLFDTGAGRTMFDQLQPVQNVCGGVAAAAGTGALPFIIPEPWLIKAGATIQVTLNNIGAATIPQVNFTMAGFKVFQFGQTAPPSM